MGMTICLTGAAIPGEMVFAVLGGVKSITGPPAPGGNLMMTKRLYCLH